MSPAEPRVNVMTGTIVPSRPTVLVVDDDANITSLLRRAFTLEGYDVSTAASGPDATRELLERSPDVIVLDVMLPGYDGVEVLRRLRAAEGDGAHAPVLLLTARDEVADRVRGLDAGADDYLAKPFAIEELTARLRALRRRRDADPDRTLRFADLLVDTGSREVRRAGREVQLTTKEYELLTFFLRNARVVVSRERLLEAVWDINFDADTHVLEVYVGYLRGKLEKAGGSGGDRVPLPRLIHTVRGVGYVLREP